MNVIATCTNNSHGVRFFTAICMYVFFLHDISKTDAARITKLDIEMFHDDSWKRIILGSKFKVTGLKNIAGMGLCTLLCDGCF